MTESIQLKDPVLVTGDSKLVSSVAVCLMLAQQPVVIWTKHITETLESLNAHTDDLNVLQCVLDMEFITITDKPEYNTNYASAIIITGESLAEKKSFIALVEEVLQPGKVIAINTESIPLSGLQKKAKFPERIIGVNWVDPAHTTYFLEVILNGNNDEKLAHDFVHHSKYYWKKDPYVINADHGIRAQLMCALIREAFYLVENGYVNFEDIDRACRNDAGYYLPFAGNFRYMDLMGTYIYGVVMKDMNPDLSKQEHVPAFFRNMIQLGKLGMNAGEGFYEYHDGDVEKWDTLARNFSYQIREIVEKYQEVV